ncbi:MAG: MFS transporter, partial [Deltaproteobacteria bacterium]
MKTLSLYLTFTLALLNFTSVMAARMLLVLYALKLGAQPFTIGTLAAMYAVLPMLLSWQVGRLSDRFGSRWLLMLGAVGGASGLLAPYFAPGLSAIYIAAVMNGFSTAFCGVSIQNLVGLLSKDPRD